MSSSSSPSRCLSVMSSSHFFEEDLSTPIATHFSPISFLSCDSEPDSLLMVDAVLDSVMMVPETPLFGIESENPHIPVEKVSATHLTEVTVPADSLVRHTPTIFVPFDAAVAEARWVETEATPWKPYEWTTEGGIAYLKLLGLWVPSVLALL